MLFVIEMLVGSASTVGFSTMGFNNPGVVIIISSSTALLASIAILLTNEYISKLEIQYIKLRDCINVITLLFEKTLKRSLVDKKSDGKEAEQLKQIYNHYLNKRIEIMNSTKYKVKGIIGDVISKHSTSQEQITKLNSFLAKKKCK